MNNIPPHIEEINARASAVENIRTDAAIADRDRSRHMTRVSQHMNNLGATLWTQLIDQARQELITEYGHPHIPMRLIANRACALAEEMPAL